MIEKLLSIPLWTLRSPKTNTNKRVLSFISTYNPNKPNLFSIIKQTFDNLQATKSTKETFKKYFQINTERQASNLDKILCPSKFTSPLKNNFISQLSVAKIVFPVIIWWKMKAINYETLTEYSNWNHVFTTKAKKLILAIEKRMTHLIKENNEKSCKI